MYIQDQIRWDQLDDEILNFYSAIGVDMIHLELRGGVSTVGAGIGEALRNGIDCTPQLEQARAKIEAHGMKLNNVFMSCWREIPLGLADADEKIEAWQRMLESLGRAGIPHLGWNFKPMGNFRTPSDIGAATSSALSIMLNLRATGPNPIARRFLKTKCGAHGEIRQRGHPRGREGGRTHGPTPRRSARAGRWWAQICSTLAQFRRIFAMHPSQHHAMLFCQGCMTELLGQGVYAAIAEMAAADKIAWVHFRNVRGQLPRFAEVFIDEGDIDMRRAMEIYRDNGFNGPYMMDHTPHFPSGRSDWLGKAYANGYIRALIQTVYN
ncbi:MAG: mannonate dehydratase [Caldilineaceae bacterium]